MQNSKLTSLLYGVLYTALMGIILHAAYYLGYLAHHLYTSLGPTMCCLLGALVSVLFFAWADYKHYLLLALTLVAPSRLAAHPHTSTNQPTVQIHRVIHYPNNHNQVLLALKNCPKGNYGIYIYYTMDFSYYYMFRLFAFKVPRDYTGPDVYPLDLYQDLWGDQPMMFWQYLLVRQPD